MTSLERSADGGTYAVLLPWLRWLDQMLQRAFEIAQSSYGENAATDPYRGLYISHEDFGKLLARGPAASTFAAADSSYPSSSEDFSRLAVLQRRFGLSPFELCIVVIALAPHIDLRYERLFAYLQDDVTRIRPTVDLVLNLLCENAEDKLAKRQSFSPQGTVLRHRLIDLVADTNHPRPSLLSQYVVLDPGLVRWLLFDDAVASPLGHICRLIEPKGTLDELTEGPLVRAIQGVTNRALRHKCGLWLYLEGPDTASKRSMAEAIAGSQERRLLRCDLRALAAAPDNFGEALSLLVRDARLRDAILLFEGADALYSDDARQKLSDFFRRLEELGSRQFLLLAGDHPWVSVSKPNWAASKFVALHFPLPGFEERREFWHSRLDDRSIRYQDGELDKLAGRFRLSEEQIDQAIQHAHNHAQVLDGAMGEPTAPSVEELCAVARELSSRHLSSMARRIESRYGWDDIVLPDDSRDQLREICNQAKYRHRVYGEWGFDRKLSLGKGLNVLFSGPPGTGKTMASEVIGSELGLNVYRIDLSQIVSKYIGETEKNLNKIFTEAQLVDVILLFDEADALFGKRSGIHDSHDRYSNIEISYLLQKMEEYEGVSILATNLRQNLDEAFTRRLNFNVEFPFPDVTSRLKIWHSIWPPEIPLSDDLDFESIATRFNLSGGSIKNIAVAAAFLAADGEHPVSTHDILRATRREFQKMGKTLSVIELTHSPGPAQLVPAYEIETRAV